MSVVNGYRLDDILESTSEVDKIDTFVFIESFEEKNSPFFVINLR